MLLVPGIRGRLPGHIALITYSAILLSLLATGGILLRQAGSFTTLVTRLDFISMYFGSYIVTHGQADHLYDPAFQLQTQQLITAPYAPFLHALPFVSPAWNALALAPLTLLNYPLAFVVWVSLCAGAGALSLWMLVPLATPTRRNRGLVLLAALAFTPFLFTLWQGQVSLIPLLGFVGAYRALQRGHDRVAGAWLLLGLIKPTLLIGSLVALVAMRRWRALATFAGGSALIFGASVLAAGNWLPAYSQLVQAFLQPGMPGSHVISYTQNWEALVVALLGGQPTPLTDGITALLTWASVALIAAICWARPQARPNWEVRWAVAMLLGLLADPHLYLHDVVVALVPAVILWRAAEGASGQARVLRGLLAAGPLVARIVYSWAPPVIQIGSWYLVLLLLAVAWAWPILATAGPDQAPTRTAASLRAAPEH